MFDLLHIPSLTLMTIGRFLIGLVLLIAAVGKWLDHGRAVNAVTSYDLLPPYLVRPVALVLPWIEFALALLLLTNRYTLLAALLTSGILALFTIAQVVVLMRGWKIDCHCFGILTQEKVGASTILRNIILLLLALAVTYFNWLSSNSILAYSYKLLPEVAPPSFIEQILLLFLALAILTTYLLISQVYKTLLVTREE